MHYIKNFKAFILTVTSVLYIYSLNASQIPTKDDLELGTVIQNGPVSTTEVVVNMPANKQEESKNLSKDRTLRHGARTRQFCFERVCLSSCGLTMQSIGYAGVAIAPIFAYLSNHSKEAALTSAIVNSVFTLQPLYLVPMVVGAFGSICFWSGFCFESRDDNNNTELLAATLFCNKFVTIFLYGTATAYGWYYYENGDEYNRQVNIGATLAAAFFYAVTSNIAGICANFR